MLGLNLSPRRTLVIAHDLIMTAAAIVASFYIRFEAVGLADRREPLLYFLPGFIAYAGIIYYLFHLYEAKWRFASLPDLMNILRASTVLAVSLLALDYVLVAPNVLGQFFFGKITIFLYWILQNVFLVGPRSRIGISATLASVIMPWLNRPIRHWCSAVPPMPKSCCAPLKAVPCAKIWPVGVLSSSSADLGQSIRGIPVLGGFA